MLRRKQIDPGHESTRRTLRLVGPLLLITGLIFLIVALADFFGAMNNLGERPEKFWCGFVGLPLMGIGIGMCKLGFLGKMTRYISQEVTPVATDTLNYAARKARPGIREIASAVSAGMRRSAGEEAEAAVRCHKCNGINDHDARFCSECGAALGKWLACPDCAELNDQDARFCDNCGRGLN